MMPFAEKAAICRTDNGEKDRWFAVQTKPSKERLALHHLANQHFQTFCPFRRIARRVGRRSVSALEPLFPSYVFIRLSPAHQRWRAINGTIGVARIVSFGPSPTALPRGFVERLQALADSSDEIAFDENLAPGERVRIMGGPLDALCGTLITADARKRVSVLLELLSGATRVDIARSHLIKA
jgi:transcriptional antiterminator RfaH